MPPSSPEHRQIAPDAIHWAAFGGMTEERWQAMANVFLNASWPTPEGSEITKWSQSGNSGIETGHWRSAGYGRKAAFQANGEGQQLLSSIVPTWRTSFRYSFSVSEVVTSDDGLHRLITGHLVGPPDQDEMDASIGFYSLDPLWVTSLVKPGQQFQVGLGLIALSCVIAATHEDIIATPPALRALLSDGDDPELREMLQSDTITIDDSELCALVVESPPTGRGDEVHFRGQITSARRLRRPVADCFGWELKVILIRFAADVEFSVLVTDHVWQSDSPPKRGQYIEGHAWVQGDIRSPPRVTHDGTVDSQKS